jgi:L-cysteine desulfidase
MSDLKLQNACLAILKEELVPATGCTEPIAIAYCAAQARSLLGAAPTRVDAVVSGNILKNVKSVIVPNTGHLKGISAAIAAGIAAGDETKALQVIAKVSDEQRNQIADFLKTVPITVSCGESPCLLDIRVTVYAGQHWASVRICNNHTNIVYKAHDGEILLDLPVQASAEDHLTDKSILDVRRIVEFADSVPAELLEPILAPQIECNSAIAEEGLRGDWGAQIGKLLLKESGGRIEDEARAYAAAGSDARMSGCELPVVILSGSGNQGITASLPVVRYWRRLGGTREELLRALAVSDLVTVQQKSGIGRLSAYCGAVSAGVGAGAGVAYLHKGGYDAVAHTVSNAVAILSGTICDGAKPSCAAKIAAAVDAGLLGWRMYCHKCEFYRGEGIVGPSVDRTIQNVGILASEGMRETDHTILRIMTDC